MNLQSWLGFCGAKGVTGAVTYDHQKAEITLARFPPFGGYQARKDAPLSKLEASAWRWCFIVIGVEEEPDGAPETDPIGRGVFLGGAVGPEGEPLGDLAGAGFSRL